MAAAALAFAASASASDVAPDFPDSFDPASITAWLRKETRLETRQVVAVGRTALSAVVTQQARSPGLYAVTLRAETLDPQIYRREGILSWTTEVEVDCNRHQVREGPTTGYELRDQQGGGRIVAPGDVDWRAPKGGTQMAATWDAVCDPLFARPLLAADQPPVRASPQPASFDRSPPQREPRPGDPRSGDSRLGERPARPAMTIAAKVVSAPPSAASRAQYSAQVGAGATAAAAERDLRKLLAALPSVDASLRPAVQPAVANGSKIYRQVVLGFGGKSDAAAFCRAVATRGRSCFVKVR